MVKLPWILRWRRREGIYDNWPALKGTRWVSYQVRGSCWVGKGEAELNWDFRVRVNDTNKKSALTGAFSFRIE